MQVVRIIILGFVSLQMIGCQPRTIESTSYVKPVKLAESYIRHYVAPGETLYSISQSHGVPLRFLIIDNNIKDIKDIPVGTVLRVRVTGRNVSTVRNDQPESKRPVKTNSISFQLRNKNLVVKDSPSYVMIPKGRGYSKPVAGKTIKNFGSNTISGSALYGVEIKSSPSAKVMSVHSGIVVFVADDLAGYGKCVLLAHDSREECFYYGLKDIYVNVGDTVHRAQVIGTLSSSAILGLKLIKNQIFIDPKGRIPGL